MKRWNIISILVVGLCVPLLSGASSSAQAASVSQKIYIRARVLPAHTIILDQQGAISEIISNTTEDVKTPKVYVGKPAADTARALTPEIYAEYRAHVEKGHSKIGTLYKADPVTAAGKPFLFENITHKNIQASLNTKKSHLVVALVKY